jgi:hypothetical protein
MMILAPSPASGDREACGNHFRSPSETGMRSRDRHAKRTTALSPSTTRRTVMSGGSAGNPHGRQNFSSSGCPFLRPRFGGGQRHDPAFLRSPARSDLGRLPTKRRLYRHEGLRSARSESPATRQAYRAWSLEVRTERSGSVRVFRKPCPRLPGYRPPKIAGLPGRHYGTPLRSDTPGPATFRFLCPTVDMTVRRPNGFPRACHAGGTYRGPRTATVAVCRNPSPR